MHNAGDEIGIGYEYKKAVNIQFDKWITTILRILNTNKIEECEFKDFIIKGKDQKIEVVDIQQVESKDSIKNEEYSDILEQLLRKTRVSFEK